MSSKLLRNATPLHRRNQSPCLVQGAVNSPFGQSSDLARVCNLMMAYMALLSGGYERDFLRPIDYEPLNCS